MLSQKYMERQKQILLQHKKNKNGTYSLDPLVKAFVYLHSTTAEQRFQQKIKEAKKNFQFRVHFNKFLHLFLVALFIAKLHGRVSRKKQLKNNRKSSAWTKTQLMTEFLISMYKESLEQPNNNLNNVKFDEIQYEYGNIGDVVELCLDTRAPLRSKAQKHFLKLWFLTKFVPKIETLKELHKHSQLTDDDLLMCVNQLILHRLDENEVLFQQNDTADGLYIILNGSVGVWLGDEMISNNNDDENDKLFLAEDIQNDDDSVKVTTLPCDSCFGEIGLMGLETGDGTRKATIVADQPNVKVVKLRKESFLVLLKKYRLLESSVTPEMKFFQTIDVWSTLSRPILHQICSIAKKITYQAGDIIIPYSNYADEKQYIFWVETGTVTCAAPKKKITKSNMNNLIKFQNGHSAKFMKYFQRIMEQSNGSLLGCERVMSHIKPSSHKKDINHSQLLLVAKTNVTVFQLHLKNVVQFLFKSNTTFAEYYQMLYQKRQILENRHQKMLNTLSKQSLNQKSKKSKSKKLTSKHNSKQFSSTFQMQFQPWMLSKTMS